MATLFTDGSTVTFGIPDSPITGLGILESHNYTKSGRVTEIRDATGYPTGKTVVVDFGQLSSKVQLTSANGPVATIGQVLTGLLGASARSFMIVKASAAYTQGVYAYQNIEGVEQISTITA